MFLLCYLWEEWTLIKIKRGLLLAGGMKPGRVIQSFGYKRNALFFKVGDGYLLLPVPCNEICRLDSIISLLFRNVEGKEREKVSGEVKEGAASGLLFFKTLHFCLTFKLYLIMTSVKFNIIKITKAWAR